MACSMQASLSFTVFWSLLRLMFTESMMPSNHLIFSCLLLPLPSILPSIRVFSSNWALCIPLPKYWSFSLALGLPMNIQGDFLLKLLVWSPCCPKDSQESSPAPQFESINSSALSLLYGPTLASIHDYWRNHSFDYTDLCQQSDISAF